tara:strand:+ start:4914 stop:5468 length:555 start_codon:yes stop_codon:yes gene_type:complete
MALKGLSDFLKQFAPYNSGGHKQKSDQAHNRGARAKDVFDFLHLVKVWPQIVGQKLAKHTLPVKNSRGVLTVLTDHPAYGQELSFLQTVLIKKIEAQFPSLKNQIKRLLFQNDPSFFSTKTAMMAKLGAGNKEEEAKKETATKYHPHSPEVRAAKKEAIENFSHIEDEEARASLISLYVQTKLK